MDYQKVGSLIATLRKEKGLTQKELSDKLGITDRAVSKWERGHGCPDVSLLDDLSRILDVSILEILKGRRLNKDEITNNRNIIESMNYSKESIHYKIKRYCNIISIVLIALISTILLFLNLKSIYYMNKAYISELDDESADKLFYDVEQNINIIKNNQGIYSDEEYAKILGFATSLEKKLDIKNDRYYASKDSYTYKEILEFYESKKDYRNLSITLAFTNTIYDTVHKYNPEIVKNILNYFNYSERITNCENEIFEQIKNPYYYNKKVSDNLAYNVTGFIYFEYYRDNILLNDIVEVGEMNE
jgi:transcriptional regulator with XRE-family HTH domain